MKSVGGEGFFFFWQNRGGFRDYFVWADFQSACLCSETLQSSGSLLHSINNAGSECCAFYLKKIKKKKKREKHLFAPKKRYSLHPIRSTSIEIRENTATAGSSYQSLLYLEIHASNLFHYFLFFFQHLQQGRTRDKLDVMPFPAGAMRYRISWFGKTGGQRYIKCF